MIRVDKTHSWLKLSLLWLLLCKVTYRMDLGLRKGKEGRQGKRYINRLCTSYKNPIGTGVIVIVLKKANIRIRLVTGTLSSKYLCTWIALYSEMVPVHYLLYSFIYLVAVTASEQIAFLTQRKAVWGRQFLHHRACSPRVTSWLDCYVGFRGCFNNFIKENICKR